MAQEMTPKTSKSTTFVLGLVAGIVAVVALLALAYIKIQNMPFNKGRDIGLLVVAVLGALTWAVCNKDELLRIGGSRGTAMNLNALGNLAAVFGILLLVNYFIVPRHLGDIKMDLTAGKYYSLSPQTRNIVKSIKSDNPIEMFAFIPMDAYQGSPDTVRSLELNKKRIEEYKRLNPNLSVTTLDPYVSKRANDVAKESGLSSLPAAGCLLRFKKDPKAVESVPSLDESQITRSLSKLLDDKGKKRKVYFLTGHGEVPMAPPAGGPQQDPLAGDKQNLGAFKQVLTDDRFEVAELPMAKEIPADCTVLAIIGPKAPFAPAEIDTIRKYLRNNGRLFVALDPEVKSNLADLLKEYGLDYQTALVEDQQYSYQEPTLFMATTLGSHPIVNDLKKSRGAVALFNRTGSFKQGTVPTEMEYAALLSSSPTSRATGGASGPFDLVVAVGKRAPADDPAKDAKADEKKPPEATNLGTRIVAVGSPWFLTLPVAGGQVVNSIVAADAANWLSDNTKDMGIRPKNPWDDEKDRKIEMTKAKLNKVMIFTFLLPLLLCVGGGIAVSVARARR